MRTARRALRRADPVLVTPGAPGYDVERFDVKQAAAYLTRTPAAVYAEVAAGRLGHRRDADGGTIRFSQQDLDEWRAARKVLARDPAIDRVQRERRTCTRATVLELPLPAKRRFR